jgi:hypothetical protein
MTYPPVDRPLTLAEAAELVATRSRPRAPSALPPQRDITKALKAAIAAGLHVAGFKLDIHTGKIEVVTGKPEAQDSGDTGGNPWDHV